MSFYKISGKVSPMSIVYLTIVCLTVIPLLSITYAYATWYIPFVGIDIAIMLLFAACVGGSMQTVIEIGKVRNTLVALLIGCIGACVALWLQRGVWEDLVIHAGKVVGLIGQRWHDDIAISLSSISLSEIFSLLIHPGDMRSLIREINKVGTYSLNQGDQNALVNGGFLTFLWIMEAFITITFSLILSYQGVMRLFLESSQQRALAKTLPPYEYISNADKIKQSLEKGDYSLLMTLRPGSTNESHSIITLYYGDSDEYYIDVRVMEYIQHGSNVLHRMQTIIKHIRIDSATGATLRACIPQH